MSVKISGASDDLIEIEGDVTAEFCTDADEKPKFLAFSDGTILHVEYADSGLWRINREVEGAASYSKWEATDSSSKQYSDVVTLGAGDAQGRGTVSLSWVVCGEMERA